MNKAEAIVERILVENQKAKEDDMYLYYIYCKDMFIKKNYALSDSDFAIVFSNKECRKQNNIKPYATIERIRRKLQADNENLCDEKTKTARINKEKDYIDYAINYSYKPTLKNLIDKEDE